MDPPGSPSNDETGMARAAAEFAILKNAVVTVSDILKLIRFTLASDSQRLRINQAFISLSGTGANQTDDGSWRGTRERPNPEDRELRSGLIDS